MRPQSLFVTLLMLAPLACTTDEQRTAPLGPAPAGGAFVHLFEWKWTDVALECENYLGPAGFAGVQISPPSEHAEIDPYPWWERYQTVSYSLAKSRSGTLPELEDMVQRCAKVGVRVYTDAVFNAMTAQLSGVGSNGTQYTKYAYPGLFAPTDFHQPPCVIQPSDYQDAPDRVRICELDGLADLNTADDGVRDKIAAYLESMVDLGVAGFRVDSAKHMYPADLDYIVTQVNQHASAEHLPLPFFYFEVDSTGSEAVTGNDYLMVGAGSGQPVSVTDFNYAALFNQFASGGPISSLRSLLTASAEYLPSAQALVFTTDHDTERDSPPAAVMYQDGAAYDLATVFLLAWPYGYPSLMSSFAFDRTSSAGLALGPPSDSMGDTDSIYAPGSTTPSCAPSPATAPAGSWVCQHRAPFVARLLAFRRALASQGSVTHFWDDGANQIAFGRGDQGFVVINLSATPLNQTLTTSLAAGDYCDLFSGARTGTTCSGRTVTVATGGVAAFDVPPMDAAVIYSGSKL
jgi:alpha-amylase